MELRRALVLTYIEEMYTTPKMAAAALIDVWLLEGFPEVSSSEVAGLPSPGIAPPLPLPFSLQNNEIHT